VLPNIGGYYFTLEFTAPGKDPVTETLSGGSMTCTAALEPEVWNLEVRGYTSSSRTDPPKVAGNISVPITEGTEASFNVYLTPDFSSGGTGGLDYSISFPASVRGWLGLYPIDDTPGTSQEIDISPSAGGTAGGTLSDLAEGSYRMVIDLYDGVNNKAAVRTESVHIYKGITTPLTRGFAAADFAECPPVVGDGATTLAAKLDAALACIELDSYTVVLDGTETDLELFAPKTLKAADGRNITITLRGNGNTVQVGSSGTPLFTLEAESGSNESSLTLVLEDVTLCGMSGNGVPVVQVNNRAILAMKAGSLITGNFSLYGGGVYSSGTITMSGGAVSGNTASWGGGVYAEEGSITTMSGGTVRDNMLSGTDGYGREVLAWGGISISVEARPERVFLYNNNRYITINGPLSGGPVPIVIDLGVTSSEPLAYWENKRILFLGYSEDLDQVTLGNYTLTESPYTERAIPKGYKISDTGHFVTTQ
jgi:hypothetical protein